MTEAKTCVSINNAEISSGQDAELVLEYIRFYELENPCKIAWRSLFGEGVDNYSNIEIANKYAQSISKLLCWYNGAYSSIIYKIKASGIPMDDLMNIDPLAADIDNLRKSLIFSRGIVPQIIDGMLAFMEMRSQEKRLEKYYQRMSAGTLTNSTACMDIAGAIKRKDIDGYKKARNTLFALIGKYYLQNRRYETLAKINRYAPEWANAIKNRQGIHGSFTVPENIADAWKWKQLERIVNEINSCDYNTLQNNSMRLAKDYHKATAELAAAKAWYELQKRNANNGAMQNALRGWVQLVKKLGKGTGKYADFYRREIRKQMTKCQDAVPVWIMPVRKVLETFDPIAMQAPFDIVIVDEASQSDLTSLAVTFLGKKIIIVGDDKQVSPLAVGTDLAPIQALADSYISRWIPNPNLYTPKDSLYSIGFVSYKSRMLLEHFRCVPEIIGYSNWLSYDNKIKPLREASSSNLLPAVVNYRVDGHRGGTSKINQVEAKTIVALVQSCMEQPEYSGKTFGVISLLGKEQAEYIQRELFNTIGNIAYEQRQIICGDSANFQGDERDVIFLSMVDSNEGDGVLRLRSDDANEDAYKKRYNVAASRAKDQLWVINSLDEENSLQAGDLRRSLLSYAKNPQAYKQTVIQIEQQSESPFEEAVAKALVSKGFHIVQQWEVGAYRIDMVAVYKNRKIAIECDGERYHSGEDKILEDMQRQTILERLGWKFIRIRGSEYFADPENTINRVADLLFTYGIKYEDNFTATPANRDTDLLQRVKQRAAEILNGENVPPKPPVQPPKPPVQPPKPPVQPPKPPVQPPKPPVQPPKPTVQPPKPPVQPPKPTVQPPKPTVQPPKPPVQLPKPTVQPPKSTVQPPKPPVQLPKPMVQPPKSTVQPPKPPAPKSKQPVQLSQELIKLLESRGVKYKDCRSKGGAFWIIGGNELGYTVSKAAELGFNFRLNAPQNAWYLEDMKKENIKRPTVIKPSGKKETIITILEKRGVAYIDKRQENGNLWIIGGQELKDIVEIAKTIGVYFHFKPEGGRISKHKPAWWAK